MPWYNFNFLVLFLLNVVQPLKALICIYYIRIHKESSVFHGVLVVV